MGRQAPDDAKAAARRRRRTDDTRRWRSRCRRRVQLFTFEADAQLFDMAIKFGELDEGQIGNKDKVSAAIGRLLRRGLATLLEKQRM